MDNFDELMEEQNEIETVNGERDYSQYIGAAVLVTGGALVYEGGKQLTKHVVVPMFRRGKNWFKNKFGNNPEPTEVETIQEPEEK